MKMIDTCAAERITRSHTMRIDASPDDAFGYLCPRREHEFLKDWKADILFSESGYVEPGCIFRTTNPDDPAATLWIVTDHDPLNHEVRFVMHTPESRVGRLTVRCAPTEGGAEPAARCTVTFTYEITAITPHGREYLDESFRVEAFESRMRGYEKAWNHFLATGRMLMD